MPEMPSMEPATSARALCQTASEVVHHPECGPMKDDIRPLIPVAAETQVDLQNRPEDQVLARQNTSGHKKRRAQSSRLRLGAADQPEDQNLLGNYIAHKIFCIGQAMQ